MVSRLKTGLFNLESNPSNFFIKLADNLVEMIRLVKCFFVKLFLEFFKGRFIVFNGV